MKKNLITDDQVLAITQAMEQAEKAKKEIQEDYLWAFLSEPSTHSEPQDFWGS